MPYHLRFFDDYGCGWLWAGNDAAFAAFDVGPLDDVLQEKFGCFTPETLAEAEALAIAHAGTLNMDDPMSPLPLEAAFCADFDLRVARLFNRMAAELGEDFVLRDEQYRLTPFPLPVAPSSLAP